ncbi:hypothetical protein PM082_023388 [Marasmius tenuissimus]|nr:hypothetical protein PM082_023388 [Marasmius tenuissimus]
MDSATDVERTAGRSTVNMIAGRLKKGRVVVSKSLNPSSLDVYSQQRQEISPIRSATREWRFEGNTRVRTVIGPEPSTCGARNLRLASRRAECEIG